jgi:AraC family transcriptional regulator of adaptative response / DNA-3-methyladenine glycosylase II
LPANVTFHRTAAAAQAAGYRACRRCLPDATPGSPAWDLRADVVGRAMRLIADGVVEREGVDGVATRLGYSTRHLNRVLRAELGAGPLALARARRAQTARLLIERTGWRFADVAFAAGFASVRQFNDTMREVYGTSPGQLRGRRVAAAAGAGAVRLKVRLPVRTPFAAERLWRFLVAHAMPAVEAAGPDWFARSLRLPHGIGTVRLQLDAEAGRTGAVPCSLQVEDLRDVPTALERCRRMLDADCDPVAVDAVLAEDPVLGPLVRSRPGLRVPGHVDGHELALRTVLGQQVSVQAGNRLAGSLVHQHGDPLPEELQEPGVTRLFPTADRVASLDPGTLAGPRARTAALVTLAGALAAGDVVPDRSADRGRTRAALLALPGIGPWTADYVAMRGLGDPDVLLRGDVALRRRLRTLGGPDPGEGEQWRPWRSYAVMQLWTEEVG